MYRLGFDSGEVALTLETTRSALDRSFDELGKEYIARKMGELSLSKFAYDDDHFGYGGEACIEGANEVKITFPIPQAPSHPKNALVSFQKVWDIAGGLHATTRLLNQCAAETGQAIPLKTGITLRRENVFHANDIKVSVDNQVSASIDRALADGRRQELEEKTGRAIFLMAQRLVPGSYANATLDESIWKFHVNVESGTSFYFDCPGDSSGLLSTSDFRKKMLLVGHNIDSVDQPLMLLGGLGALADATK